MRKHDERVTFSDEEKGTQWSKPADELPEAMRFHRGVPVVQVVRTASGNIFSTQEYGQNNELLRSRGGVRSSP